MKAYYKIFLVIISIVILSSSVVHAESIKDNTYLVFIWTPVSSFLDPRWVDQFEFDSGDVYRAYTTRQAHLSGTWMETELIDLSGFSLNWFQAYVEKAEPTTTTTTTPENTTTTVLVTGSVATPQQVKYDIHLWGIAYTYTLSFPDESTPDDDTDKISIGFSILSGYGAYLGADATFWGITGTGGSGGGGGGEPQFGSISPETGKQESTLKGVEITAKNTTFEDDGVNEVIFVPDDGITVSNIKTTDNTTIEVDLTIRVDASLEDRTVIVSWDDPVQTVSSADVGKYFTVTE